MPPKTRISLTTGKPFTPEEVALDLSEREIVPQFKGKKNKHPRINKNIELTTESPTIKSPTIEQIWLKDVFEV